VAHIERKHDEPDDVHPANFDLCSQARNLSSLLQLVPPVV